MQTLKSEMFKDYPDVVSAKQLQEMLKISRHEAYDLLASGVLHATKIDGKYLIPKVFVINYLWDNFTGKKEEL